MALYVNGQFLGDMVLGRAVFPRPDLADMGAKIATSDPIVAATLDAVKDAEWQWGFKVGTAISQGNSAYGPGQAAVFALMTKPQLRAGFLAAQQQQYAITKSRGGLTQSAGPIVQATNPDEGGGISRPVLIGGGVIAVLAIGLVAYKLTR